MKRIVVLDRDTYAPGIDTHGPNIEHDWTVYGATTSEQIVERVQGAHIVITNKVPMRAETLAQLPDLEMISVSATGYDVIDIAACEERKITVSNVRGYAVNTLPEHTFALILSLRRQIVGYRQDVIDGKWQASGQFCFHTHPMQDLNGSTLGIIGEGNLGQSVADLGKAFGMRILFAAHKGVEGLGPLYTPFEQVMEESDVITLHCPLTAHTRNVLAMPEFRQMKKRPLIVNTARGGLVHEGDLVKALDEGLIAGIGFDVLTKEPPAADNPLLTVLERPNVIVTPHMSWASHEAQVECWRQTVANIENFAAGTASNVVV
ncbi:MAG: D-2-hydroxyacid dehydrogenase [Rhodobacteraceae bacterium]|nr:D-2-hydroxyacid dehydrogenase [Paracoccaceae bacterium]